MDRGHLPGILLNVAAGRVANRLDLGGANYTVDAACASSLAAVYQAVLELETGRSDLVIAGGVDTVQGPSATSASARRRRCRRAAAAAPSTPRPTASSISEGFAMLVLKRLADAERDGDRIYAVIKGVGGSSDGRAKSLTAPRPEGQIRALKRAYAQAGYSPATRRAGRGARHRHGRRRPRRARDRDRLSPRVGRRRRAGTPSARSSR